MVLRWILRRPCWVLRMWPNSAFGLLFLLSQTVAAMAVGLILYLIYTLKKGLAWTAGETLFNFHILLMPLALSFIYGIAMLLYRAAPPRLPRTVTKALHSSLLGLAFILTVLGLQAVFQAHGGKVPPIPPLYSLHSWVGLLTVILFAAQLAAGFLSFLYPGLPVPSRRVLLPFHTCGGILIFVLSFVSVMTGLTEHIVFREYDKYKLRQPFGIVANIIGMLVMVHAFLVLLLVLLPHFQRQPAPLGPSQVELTHPDTRYSNLVKIPAVPLKVSELPTSEVN